MLNHDQTLVIVEKFMIDSGIRKYCTEICKGRCCETCFKKNKQACYLQEGRRLPCSIYLCRDITDLFSKEDANTLRLLNSSIKKQYETYNQLRGVYVNVYFSRPDQNFLEIVRFPEKIEHLISEVNIIAIKSLMNKLTKKKIKIHKALCALNYDRKNHEM